jgi:predicted dehydrogenase
MSERRRALIVGCGKIAGGYNRSADDPMVLTHALAYIRHREHDLVACVDPDEKVRQDFMRKWNVPCGYTNVGEALGAGGFDVASVCGPTGTHLAALSALREAGLKAVFAEKPLDGDAVGAKKIGREFAQRNVPIAVNFTRRFDPSMQALKAAIAARRYGDLRSMVGWCGADLMNLGSHMIDLAIFLTGSVPKLRHVQKTGGGVSVLFDLSGAPFHLLAAGDPASARFEAELTFAQAIVTIEDNGLALRTRRIAPSPVFPGAALPERGEWEPTGYGAAMLTALDELIAWRPGDRLSSDIESACESIALTEEVIRRAQEARA